MRMLSDKDLRELRGKYIDSQKDSNLTNPPEFLPENPEYKTSQQSKSGDGSIRKRYLLLTLPLGLVLCTSAFLYAYYEYLLPKLNPDEMHQGTSMMLSWIVILIPVCYVWWSSFCLILLLLSYLIRDTYNKIQFIFTDLYTALILFVPVMWVWFFILRQPLRDVIDSAIAIEAWLLLGIFVTLFILMLAVFLKGYLLTLYYSDEGSSFEQNKTQYLKNMSLCFFTLIITAISIVYI